MSAYNDPKYEEARRTILEHSKSIIDEMRHEGFSDNMLSGQSEFARTGTEFMLRGAFDGIWGRPGLEKKYRSLTVIAILAATGKIAQLKSHVGMGLTNGLTEEEIGECLLHVMGYCGFPAGLDAFAAADQVIAAAKKESS